MADRVRMVAFWGSVVAVSIVATIVDGRSLGPTFWVSLVALNAGRFLGGVRHG